MFSVGKEASFLDSRLMEDCSFFKVSFQSYISLTFFQDLNIAKFLGNTSLIDSLIDVLRIRIEKYLSG